MGIARSLRKAGYLRPVAGAVGNYLESLEREKQQEEYEASVKSLFEGIQQINAQRVPTEQGPMIGEGVDRRPSTMGFTGATPEQKYKQLGSRIDRFNIEQADDPESVQTALSGLLGRAKPEEAKVIKTEPYKIDGTVFGRGPGGKVDFSEPVYQTPEVDKSKGFTLNNVRFEPDPDKPGEFKEVARVDKKKPPKKRTRTGGYWGDDGNWVNTYSDKTEEKTRFQKPKTQQETDLYEARKNLSALENQTPDADGYYPDGGKQAEHKATIETAKANITFLKDEVATVKGYFNKKELADFEALKKKGFDVEALIKHAKLEGKEADALRKLYEGLGG